MEIKRFGSSALLINFEQRIDEAVNRQVMELKRKIESSNIGGFLDAIPGYCSLTVTYNPLKSSFDEWKSYVESVDFENQENQETRKLRIPICYASAYAMDMDEVIYQTKLSREEIIQKHTEQEYRVYMLGFIPGFAYMGKLSDELQVTRKTTPRTKVPTRSLGLAGNQTGIYPCEGPGGWQIIGSCPVNLGLGDQFLFKAGDTVQFYEISQEMYLEMREEKEEALFKRMLNNG
jgi:inhibitor of KinA